VNCQGQTKKISVIGAGAVGTLFAGLIKQNQPNVEIVLVGRGAHLKAMQKRGVAELRGPWGIYKAPVHATEDPEALRDSDLVLFTVKTRDTRDAAEKFADACGRAILVSLQNGINQRELLRFFPHDRLLVGMTTTNMTSLNPGIVEFHRNGVSVIGPATKQVPKETLQHAHRILTTSGLWFEAEESILGVQYNKLLINTMGYASVLSAADLIQECIMKSGWRNNLAIPLLDEGMRVLMAAGINLRRTPGAADAIRMRKMMSLLNIPTVNPIARPVVRMLKPRRIVFSVFQDIKLQRPTEIEYVNGEIVRLANEHGCDAPYNEEVVRAIHELENMRGQNFFEHQQVIDRFAQLRKSTR